MLSHSGGIETLQHVHTSSGKAATSTKTINERSTYGTIKCGNVHAKICAGHVNKTYRFTLSNDFSFVFILLVLRSRAQSYQVAYIGSGSTHRGEGAGIR